MHIIFGREAHKEPLLAEAKNVFGAVAMASKICKLADTAASISVKINNQ